MTTENKIQEAVSNISEVESALVKYSRKVGFVFIGVCFAIGIFGLFGAFDGSLQGKVEAAQSAFENNKTLYAEATTRYCLSWKELATAKADLANSLKMKTEISAPSGVCEGFQSAQQ